jgi:hypothetical protein
MMHIQQLSSSLGYFLQPKQLLQQTTEEIKRVHIQTNVLKFLTLRVFPQNIFILEVPAASVVVEKKFLLIWNQAGSIKEH